MRNSYPLGHEAALRDQYFVAQMTEPDDYLHTALDYDPVVPSLLLQKNYVAAAPGTIGYKRTVLDALTIMQLQPAASVSFRMAVYVDATARYSSGGVAVTPRSLRPGWVSGTDPAAELVVYQGSYDDVNAAHVEVSLPGSTYRKVQPAVIPASEGLMTTYDFQGKVWLDRVGSVLVFIFLDDPPGTTPGTFDWSLTFYEEPLPRGV